MARCPATGTTAASDNRWVLHDNGAQNKAYRILEGGSIGNLGKHGKMGFASPFGQKLHRNTKIHGGLVNFNVHFPKNRKDSIVVILGLTEITGDR